MSNRTDYAQRAKEDGAKQVVILDHALHATAEVCSLFDSLVKDGLTRVELLHLISARPSLWSRFAGWVDKLP